MAEAVANNGNDLIVGFSVRRRQTESDDTDSKQVSFSQDITENCFQYPSRKEVSKRRYSKRDKSIFKQEMKRDIQSIRYQLSITPMEAVEKEILYGCIGLEAYVTSKVTRFLEEKKQGYARSIVEMQDCLSDEQLAAYAEARSSESSERAQQLAASYSSILSESDTGA
jgi:hypothetical protein